MKSFYFSIPTKIYFGSGEVNRVGHLSKGLGKKALLLAAKDTMRKLGYLERVTKLLNDSGIEVVVSDDVDPNPKDIDIDRQTKLFIESNCDFTVGLGGGSSLDSAKAVAFLSAQGGGSILNYLAGGACANLENTKPAAPIVCITTTAGTGSEVTPWWVVTNTKDHEKPGTGNDSTQPTISIIDPELMLSIPKKITRNTGIDVFFHAMESYISKVATPFTEILSIEAMKIVVDNLEKLLINGTDIENRSKMAWANVLAGIAIGEGRSNTVAIHALGHSVGGQTNAAHGLAMAVLAPAFMEKTWDSDIYRYAQVTRILGYSSNGENDEKAASRSSEAIKGFLERCGFTESLKDLGVTKEMIEPMTDSVYKTMLDALNCTLKELSRSDVIEIFNKSF